MRWMMVWCLVALAAVPMGCGTGSGSSSLCSSTFQPYPDIITGRVVRELHRPFLDGMEAYSQGDHEEAAKQLQAYVDQLQYNKAAHLYLANSYLALGKPFEAELQLDHLENSNLKDYVDQTEWYTVVCWVCSDQLDRALTRAQKIATGRRHTYKSEAQQLVAKLEKRSS